MTKNMGSTDRIIRVTVALILGVLILTGGVEGVPAVILGIAAIVLLLTSAVSTCPLYMPFHLSTRSRAK